MTDEFYVKGQWLTRQKNRPDWLNDVGCYKSCARGLSILFTLVGGTLEVL